MEHLLKYLANSGVASRRKVDQMVRDGRVSVNGKKVIDPGLTIDPQKDEISVDGKKIQGVSQYVYIMLNKPKGVISTVSDEKKRQTVVDLVKTKARVYPVGRLDEDSTGLILLTNDGQLANKLTHPRYEIPKTYQVAVRGEITEERLRRLREGVRLKEGITSLAEVEVVNPDPKRTLLQMTIHEGWNRQIRRMCGVVGLNVVALKRVAMGPLQLGDLQWGEWRNLTAEEVSSLKNE